MLRFVARISGWIHRFITSIQTLGLINTKTIFHSSRRVNALRTIALPNKQLFYFQPRYDQGVLSHFYKEGYFIEDSAGCRVQTIIDGGANIGDETARFHIHHPAAAIVAVEAAERNFSILQKTFANNPAVHLIHGAVWPTQTRLQLNAASSMEAFHVTETESPVNSVAAWTIPAIMENRGWSTIDILKLDIEGAEYEVFTRNYANWIERVRCFIFEVPDNDRAGTTQQIYRSLNARDYSTYVCGENIVLIRSDTPWRLHKVIGFHRSDS